MLTPHEAELTLSEAMRLGAMLKPQGSWSNSIWGAETCALGAAADAIGLQEDSFVRMCGLSCAWPVLMLMTTDPVTGRRNTVTGVIWALNDHHHWTREQIADWVATVESQDSASWSTTPARSQKERTTK